RPSPKSMDFDTKPFIKQYEWLGYQARPLIFDLLEECLADPELALDVAAYDLDEPDIIRNLAELGPRLRILMDDASLHTGPTALSERTLTLCPSTQDARNTSHRDCQGATPTTSVSAQHRTWRRPSRSPRSRCAPHAHCRNMPS